MRVRSINCSISFLQIRITEITNLVILVDANHIFLTSLSGSVTATSRFVQSSTIESLRGIASCAGFGTVAMVMVDADSEIL